MADAGRARAERRAALTARVAQTAPNGGPPCRSPSPATNAATGPAGNEQQASSMHPLVRREGRTATPSLTPAGSSSHAHRAPADAHAALLLARELLHYHPVDDLYEEWLTRITELISTAGGSPARSPLAASPSILHGWCSPGGASATSSPRRRPGSKARGPWTRSTASGARAIRKELPRNPSSTRRCSRAPRTSTP